MSTQTKNLNNTTLVIFLKCTDQLHLSINPGKGHRLQTSVTSQYQKCEPQVVHHPSPPIDNDEDHRLYTSVTSLPLDPQQQKKEKKNDISYHLNSQYLLFLVGSLYFFLFHCCLWLWYHLDGFLSLYGSSLSVWWAFPGCFRDRFTNFFRNGIFAFSTCFHNFLLPKLLLFSPHTDCY